MKNNITLIKAITILMIGIIFFYSMLVFSTNFSNIQIDTKHEFESDNNTVMIMQAVTELTKDGVNYGEKTTCIVRIPNYDSYLISEHCYPIKTNITTLD